MDDSDSVNMTQGGQGNIGKKVFVDDLPAGIDDFDPSDSPNPAPTSKVLQQPFETQGEDEEEKKPIHIHQRLQEISEKAIFESIEKISQLDFHKVAQLTQEQIDALIAREQMESASDSSVIYRDGKMFDEKKKAVYGIKPI